MSKESVKNFFKTVGSKLKSFFIMLWTWIKKGAVATWRYIKTRRAGFFLLIPVVVLSFIEPFVYSGGFFDTEYESITTFMLPFFVILCFALAFEKHTARYAPLAMFVLSLVSLLEFVRTTYMHLSTAFFAGVNGNVLEQAGFPFSFCAIVLAINILLCAVAMFFRQYKGEKKVKASKKHAPAIAEETALEVQDGQG